MTTKTAKPNSSISSREDLDAPGTSSIQNSESRIQNSPSSTPTNTTDDIIKEMLPGDNGLTGIPELSPENYPDLYDPEKPLDPAAFPQFYKRYRMPIFSEPMSAYCILHVPNSKGVSPDEYRARQLDRLFMHQALTNLPARALLGHIAAEQPYYRCIVHTTGIVHSRRANKYLLPWDSIPRDEPPDPRDMSYSRSVQEIYDRHNEDEPRFPKKEKWVREHFEKMHFTNRVIGVAEQLIFNPDKLNLAPHPEVPDPELPSADEIDHRIAEAMNTDTTDYYHGAPAEEPVDPAAALPRKIENAAEGTPADTENRIHDVAYQAICECEATIAILRARKPKTADQLRRRVRDICNLSQTLVQLRDLHRPLQPRPRGRPRKGAR